MVNIRKATYKDAETLSLLGRITYTESHGHFIATQEDLQIHCEQNFGIEVIEESLKNPNHEYYLAVVDGRPVGYAKLGLNANNEHLHTSKNCQLERIYVLADFLHLKIGRLLLNTILEKASSLEQETIWLTVYIKNQRAITFYHKNGFKKQAEVEYFVNGTNYENYLLIKSLTS